jgi:hypothetical protein
MTTTAHTPNPHENEPAGPAALFDRARKQIKGWTSARLDDLQERTTSLTEKRDELLKHSEDRIQAGKEAVQDRRLDLLTKRDEAAKAGMEHILNLETIALEGARDLLARAEDLAGPKARFLARGRAALDDAIVSVRSGHAGGLPIEDYDALSIAKIRPHLEGMASEALKTLQAYEAANKKRKTLLRELDALLTEPEAPAE